MSHREGKSRQASVQHVVSPQHWPMSIAMVSFWISTALVLEQQFWFILIKGCLEKEHKRLGGVVGIEQKAWRAGKS